MLMWSCCNLWVTINGDETRVLKKTVSFDRPLLQMYWSLFHVIYNQVNLWFLNVFLIRIWATSRRVLWTWLLVLWSQYLFWLILLPLHLNVTPLKTLLTYWTSVQTLKVLEVKHWSTCRILPVWLSWLPYGRHTNTNLLHTSQTKWNKYIQNEKVLFL